MGSAPGASFSGSPGLRPDFPRSSSQSAHGQASRRNLNVYVDRWPSFHSISSPAPVVTCTFTDFGSFASRGVGSTMAMESVSHARFAGERCRETKTTGYTEAHGGPQKRD